MTTPNFHAEPVGSLLRTTPFLEAKAKMRAGEISHEAFKVVEDQAVDDAIRLQEDAGLQVLTDGEIRRNIFFDFFVSGTTGLEPIKGGSVRFRDAESDNAMEVTIPFTVTNKLVAGLCPGVAEFNYSKQRTDRLVKVTLPSPMMILGFWNKASLDVYPNPFDLAADAAKTVGQWMTQLADAGCKCIQIDAPELNEAYADAAVRDDLERQGIDPREYIELGTQFVADLGNLDLPGVRKVLHVCKGNGTQSWIAEGGYDDFSKSVFKKANGYDVYHMEYDDARSGGFEPLANLPDDKMALLGLVSTKWKRLETVEELVARFDEAKKFHPLEQLGLAPQCGFASAGEGAGDRKITDEVQVAKLSRIVETAQKIWP